MCTIEADTSIAGQALAPRRGLDGQIFYALEFDIILLFGLTEFKAQICWKENVRLSTALAGRILT